MRFVQSFVKWMIDLPAVQHGYATTRCGEFCNPPDTHLAQEWANIVM
jgi:hypothetical protein